MKVHFSGTQGTNHFKPGKSLQNGRQRRQQKRMVGKGFLDFSKYPFLPYFSLKMTHLHFVDFLILSSSCGPTANLRFVLFSS